jgi:transposase
MRFIVLAEEELNLVNLLEKTSSNHIVRLRCNLLKLSNNNISMKEVSKLTNIKWLRIVDFFNAWDKAKNIQEKQDCLSIKKGRGAKNKLEKVKHLIPKLVQDNSRNLNKILAILEEKHQVKICKLTLQNFLKDTKI